MDSFKFRSICTNVHKLERQKYSGGIGKDAFFSTESRGWYITVANEFSIYVGMEKPKIEIGQGLEITIKGVET